MRRFLGGKDIRYFFNAILIALVAMMVLVSIEPFLDPKAKDIKEASKSLTQLAPADLPALLVRKDGKSTMLFIYASWCPYCKELMPTVASMLRHKELPFEPLFYSTDEHPYKLMAYIVHGDYAGLFTPYIRPEKGGPLSPVMQRLGSQYQGGIPHIAFFDPNGHLISEIRGSPSPERFREIVKQVSDKSKK